MGIYTDLASTSPIPGKPRVGLDRTSGEQLLSKAALHDPSVGSAYAGADEVSVIPEQTDAGAADTYTITLEFPTVAGGTTVTTAAIAYNAVPATIEGAIDTAMTSASFPSWTNADISVSGSGAAGIDDGTVTLTFDGTSVNNIPCLVTWTATGFTANGSTTRSTPGQVDRKAAQALFELNVISGSLWNSGEQPSGLTRPASNGQSRPRYQLIRDLAIQAAVENGKDYIYDAVVALYPVV